MYGKMLDYSRLLQSLSPEPASPRRSPSRPVSYSALRTLFKTTSFPKHIRAEFLFSDPSTNSTFAATPLVLTPFVRNQTHGPLPNKPYIY